VAGEKPSEGSGPIVHVDECDLLREWLSDPPLDGSPRDGRGVVPDRPTFVDSLPLRDQHLQEILLDALGQRRIATAVGTTLVQLYPYGPPKAYHVFLVADTGVARRATEVYEQQQEIVGHNIEFVVEVVGSLNLGLSSLWHEFVGLGGIFAEEDLPPGYSVRKTRTKDRVCVVRKCPNTPVMTDEVFSEVREELVSWLRAYTFFEVVGLRIVDEAVVALRRRSLCFRTTDIRAWTIHAPIAASRLRPVFEGDQDPNKPKVQKALDGLNMICSAHNNDEFLLSLWRTLEDVFCEEPPSALKGLDKAEKGMLRTAFCEAFGQEGGERFFGLFGSKVREGTPSEVVAQRIAETLPECSCGEALDAVKAVYNPRGVVAHTVTSKDIPQEALLLVKALRRFVETECGLDTAENDEA